MVHQQHAIKAIVISRRCLPCTPGLAVATFLLFPYLMLTGKFKQVVLLDLVTDYVRSVLLTDHIAKLPYILSTCYKPGP